LVTIPKQDLYEILGVGRKAPLDEIKRAFRSKARLLHPDNKESGDEQAFKDLAAAYEVLSDERKRSLYDRYGHDGLSGGQTGFEGFDLSGFSDLADIFNHFFGTGMGSRRSRSAAERGADLKLELTLEFTEAIFGTDKKVTVMHLERCTTCDGSGAAAGSKPVTCSTCGGQGQVQQTTATFLGHFTQVLTCPNCRGEGKRIETPCQACRGQTQLRKSREIELTVPPGIDSGVRLRIPGAGDEGRRGGPAGDVYVILKVKEHKFFQREGRTIHLKQPISFSLAALGGDIMVPSLEGETILKVPAGTQSGATITLKGLGTPYLDNPIRRGDQVVHLVVETPERLSAEEKNLFRKLAELRGEKLKVDPHEGGGQSGAGTRRKSSRSEKMSSSIIDKITDVFKPRDDSSSD